MSGEKILMAHGSGGRMMHRLIEEIIAPVFEMKELGDAALLENTDGGRLAFTTDSYVVSPLFFPGGNIGHLAVCGTVNDLSMAGARPIALSVGLILEEGLDMDILRTVLATMAETAKAAGVRIVAGDTKVVERGKCDGIFINTAGIGVVSDGLELGPVNIHRGDHVIVSGPVGTHGVAVMAERNGLHFDPPVESDTAALNGLVGIMIETVGSKIRVMRDPTRGGLATTLKELSVASGQRIRIFEKKIPMLGGVKGACELLGLDPLYVANEGVLVAIVSSDGADELLDAMRKKTRGRSAADIGLVTDEADGKLVLETLTGGTRLMDLLTGEQLPRIC